MLFRRFIYLTLVCFSTTLIDAPALFASRPNIVFVLADDLGYGDVGALNRDSRIPTPNLKRLAASGMTFTDAHTPSAVCTPTRYGLLTGRYCWRSRLKKGVLNGYSPPLIEDDRPTVASLLGSAGYHTAIVGKWHLGLGFAKDAMGDIDFRQSISRGPNDLGFAWSYVIPASLDFPPYIFIEDHTITNYPSIPQPAQRFPAFLRKGPRAPDLVMEDCLDHLLNKAVEYLHRRAGNSEPFFLYVALTAPHKPVLPHERFRGKTGLGPYGDFIVQVDWTIGQILNAIEKSEQAENTLVIVTSDNGSFMYRRDDASANSHVDDETIQAYRSNEHRSNYVFRGTKADIWEAGHHVPFFATWPGRIEPNSTCDETICLTDFFATAAHITTTPIPQGAAEDSFSFLSHMKGETPATPRPPVIHHSANGTFAIREGDWKLVLGDGSGGRERPVGKPFQKPYQLFDLSKDPAETSNVISRNQHIADRLEEIVGAMRE